MKLRIIIFSGLFFAGCASSSKRAPEPVWQEPAIEKPPQPKKPAPPPLRKAFTESEVDDIEKKINLPASFAPKRRLMLDSKRSPACATAESSKAIIATATRLGSPKNFATPTILFITN